MNESPPAKGWAVTVVLGDRVSDIEVGPEESIFSAARREGLELPFSCVAGVCGECVATVEAGEAEMKVNLALSQKQLDRGLVLACQARPRGPGCRIRFDARP